MADPTANERTRKHRETPEGREKARAASRRWQENNREKAREASRRAMLNRKKDDAAGYWYGQLSKRAADQGREFDLTEDFLEGLLSPMLCSMTGLPLSYDWDSSITRVNPWAPSIDRIDSTKGYTKDNVRVVAWIFNLAKGPWDDTTVLRMAEALLRTQNGNP